MDQVEPVEAQAFSVKRAEVEFHNFASLGEPERVQELYARENQFRCELLRRHGGFIGSLTPFLEIGANVGHTSFMLVNEFGADGFALDISADALRYGIELQSLWGLPRGPVRVAGDAANLPFRDGSLRLVVAFQMLSQFSDIERVFLEVKRVLVPGGVFLFAEEPLRRLLSLRLYRCPYYDRMKPWERKLFEWGLLDYLVRDVIGAYQEESFGIRQNHSMGLKDWDQMIRKHFVAYEHEVTVPERGWGMRVVKRLAVRFDPHRSDWRAARLLGGTLAAICRKEGDPAAVALPPIGRFEEYLRCPDCHAGLSRDAGDTLICPACGYSAGNEGGVYNLLPAAERSELYPGDRDDIVDFSLPGHEKRLLEGWFELEGQYGNRYRWMGPAARARLCRVKAGPQKLRVRGYVPDMSFQQNQPVWVQLAVNGRQTRKWTLHRPGAFVLETDVEDAPEYMVEISASPVLKEPEDPRPMTVIVGMIRLVPRE